MQVENDDKFIYFEKSPTLYCFMHAWRIIWKIIHKLKLFSGTLMSNFGVKFVDLSCVEVYGGISLTHGRKLAQ